MNHKLKIFYALISFILLALALTSNYISLELAKTWPSDVNNTYLIHSIITSIILLLAITLFITSIITFKANKK